MKVQRDRCGHVTSSLEEIEEYKSFFENSSSLEWRRFADKVYW